MKKYEYVEIKEKMQEDDIELKNCVHMIATRLIKCVPIVVTTQ